MKRRTSAALFMFVLAAHEVSPATATRSLLRRETNVIAELANANSKTEEGDRNLKMDEAYVEPVWFDSYKEIAGKAFKRCKPLNNIAPADGSVCTQMKVGDYTCAFEDQTCPDGSIHPKIKCNCNIGTGGGVWSCEEYKPCEVTPPVTTCPTKHPISFNPPLTCSEGMICPIGTKRCCGKVFPRFVCTCINGVFDCKDDKSCAGTCPPKSNSAENSAMLPIRPYNVSTGEYNVTSEKPAEAEKHNSSIPPAGNMDTCPNPGSLTPPTIGTDCTLDRSELCHYDKICCCDKCDDRFSCSCEDGKWQCVELAYRCAPCNNTTSEPPIETKPPDATISPESTCPNPESLVPPEDGSKCSIEETQVCHYDKTCCCDDCMDRFTCICVDGAWQCGEIAVKCMGPCPPAIKGTTCDAGSVVEEGQKECCGSILPVWRCRCGSEGTYECTMENPPWMMCSCAAEPPVEVGAKNETDSGSGTATKAPPLEEVAGTCPNPDSIVPPEDGSKCSVDPTQVCHYDKTCCCDDCTDRFSCTCVDGAWQCVEVAMGCMGPCPPAIKGTTCDAGSVVEEGQTECCGSILPVWRCRCGSAGTYECTMENPPWMMCSCAMEPPVEGGVESPPPTAGENETDSGNATTTIAPPPGDLAGTCPNPDSIVPPESGSKCSVDPTLVCHYDKTCCCDDCTDRFSCTCVDGAWQCAEVAMACMGPCPPAIKGTTCDAGSVVEEGQTECCGSILPVWRCRCGSAGTYECVMENPPWMMCSCAGEPLVEGVETAAPTAGNSVVDSGSATTTGAPPPGDLAVTCPNPDSIVPPEYGSKCSVDPTLTCHYDKTCCCDVCGDRFFCNCVDGAWQCLERAMSCMGPCPPAIKGKTCEAGSVVENGQKECCGSILPVWVCRCGSAGTYECTMENSPWMMCMCAQPAEDGNTTILI